MPLGTFAARYNAAMPGTGDPDAAFAAIAQELDGFSAGGLTVEIRMNQDVAGTWNLIGAIYDDARYQVGGISRDLLIDDDRWHVFHKAFELESHAQGTPFRTAFFEHAEAVYAKHGIDDIRVSAEKIGSYLWAKEGFRFCGDECAQRRAEIELWQSRGRALAEVAVTRGDLPDAAREEIEATFAAIAACTRAPLELRELADLAKQHTWVANGHTVWLGKEMLIGWKWNGIKDL